MGDFQAFLEFKKEIKEVDNLKDLDFIFRRVMEQKDLKTITNAENDELMRDVHIKHDFIYNKDLTEQQKKEIELKSLTAIQRFRAETVLKSDEEWRGDTIYCKKCGTPRSCILENNPLESENNEPYIAHGLCKCQAEEYEKETERKRIAEQKRIALERLNQNGINVEKYKFENFETNYKFQQVMAGKTKEFLQDIKKSIIITGQSGCGKTFILSTALVELANGGHLIQYLKWLEQGKHIKSLIMDAERYSQEIWKYKTCEILYIDDFLKTGKNSTPTDADISLALEIIDFRKENHMATMISSERSLQEILSLDEALGGRILELCKIRLELNNKDFPDLINYRLKF